MESPNAPAHDFAPAWLKLPAPTVYKKPSTSVNDSSQPLFDSQQQRRYSNSYNSPNHRKEFNNSTNNIPNSDSQQRLNCNIHDSSQNYLSSRHNSFGNEEQYNKPNGHVIGNNVNSGRFNKKYIDSTQRSTYRSTYYNREKNINPHHSKLNRNSDSSKPLFSSTNKKPLNNKSSDFTLDNEFGGKNASNEENCNVFNKEFPSLVVDESNPKNGGLNDNSTFHSAWSNNATKSKVLSTSKYKVQLIQRSVANFDNIDSGSKSETISIVNNTKTVITSPVYRNISLIGKAKGGIIKENANYSKILPVLTKSSTQTTTPAMEILVKNPKMRSNKSDFFNSMRNNDSKDKELSLENNGFDDNSKKVNAISENDYESNRNVFENSETKTKSDESDRISFDDLDRTDINSLICQHEEEDEEMGANLSSSLEAEHRLLMELGWNGEQDDDPSYAPLTEDEVNEFKDLISARNGFKRNTTATMPTNQTLHLNLSPKKMPTVDAFTHTNYSEDESSSSSDDD